MAAGVRRYAFEPEGPGRRAAVWQEHSSGGVGGPSDAHKAGFERGGCGGVEAAIGPIDRQMQMDAAEVGFPEAHWRWIARAFGSIAEWIDDGGVAVFGSDDPRVYGGFAGDGRGGVHPGCGVCSVAANVGGLGRRLGGDEFGA